MEAASARFAARDRFGPFGQQPQSQLQRFIQNAVDPQNFEPNLALDLEIADIINTKKGNAPREAATAIVTFINHRNQNVCLLALTLLDICVKNCGYPFHLQISTKEFLNELVRRFPERPPVRPNRVQSKILEAIEEWRQTICQTSRYKEDLGFIRDMHRLLSYKGYLFPQVRREDAAVLNPSDNLKSAEEMEEEERSAQSAKLQELIRRGGPEDLQEANKLMKVMAGYDTRNKTDYRAKAAEEVGKVQQKAKLLEERLQNFKPGDNLTDGDVFEELANSLRSAHPKIQKMCEEESEDQEAVAKLFEINDSINRTIERYKLIKSGDIEAAERIPKGTLGTTTGVGKNANNELSLIDFGGDLDSETEGKDAGDGQQQTQSLEDDLLGLSFQDQPFGQGGGISLGLSSNPDLSTPPPGMPGFQLDAMKPPTPSLTPQAQPKSAHQPPQPNYNLFSSFSNSPNPSGFSKSVTSAPNKDIANDPFDILSGPKTQQPTASTPTPTASSSLLAQSTSTTPLAKASRSANGAGTEDDWDFSSALPEESLPSSNTITVSQKAVAIVFDVSRSPKDDSVIKVQAKFSNKSKSLITEYTFQLAVTKAFTLKLTPQSGRKLQPFQENGITQPIEIHGVARGQAENVKMRWKASYKDGGQQQQEQGEVPPLGIA